MVTLESAITNLSQQASVIMMLLERVSQEQAIWKPSPPEWSLLEIINHLADEEQEDVRTRFDLMLHQPQTHWLALDPAAWVSERNYNSRDLQTSLQRCLGERQSSLEWLNKLKGLDLENIYHHSSGRSLRHGNFLASWVAHDLLHIRQLTRLHYQYLQKDFKIDYAGNW